MQARLIAYPPDAAAVTRWIPTGERLTIGREPTCGLVIEHPSISRNHAEIHFDGEGWRVRDLGSKNGTFVDGIQARDHPLPKGCWLRLGDCHIDFGVYDDERAAQQRDRQSRQRALSQALTRQMTGDQGQGDSLPAHVLRGVVELAGCSRGFMLLSDPKVGDFTVRASLQMDPDALDDRAFSGSVGAVQRVLGDGRPLVVNDVGGEQWLAGRASVITGGMTTLVCLPLSDGHEVFGAIYADRRNGPGAPAGEPITDFELELLGAFTESATLYLLARRAMQSLDAPRWRTILERQATLAHEADAAR
ncbi:FHA domain-containing protein [Agrilutibacter solisilvae]|uniref:FHA domain-containing protein n=1 Tax=Agrilutibacter solisilvae TaxID=2763317 RepID=A0A974XWH7_9GAMM|nr:FHA domain-containing protein [Lysobacter solisilvae]QSX77171.1 FHA domain-containing protein [Lysobacter solisilvae]